MYFFPSYYYEEKFFFSTYLKKPQHIGTQFKKKKKTILKFWNN